MPTIHFTIKALQALEPPLGRPSVEYWDASKPGFGIRVSAGGKKVWIVRYKIRRTKDQDRATLGRFEAMNLADARLLAGDYLNAAQRGINLKAKRDQERQQLDQRKYEDSKTFGWLASKYLNDPEVQLKRSFKEDKRIIEKEILEFWKQPGKGWAKRHLNTITKADVRLLLDSTLERTLKGRKGRPGKGIHANRVFSKIRRVFNFGIEKDYIAVSPCLGLKRPLKHELSRDNVLPLESLRKLWGVLDHDELAYHRSWKLGVGTRLHSDHSIQRILKIMTLTLQRGSEVRSMAKEDIDLERRVWTIPGSKTKNKRSHSVPLSDQAFDLIREQLATGKDSIWVFQSPVNSCKHIEHFQKAIQRFRKLSGVSLVGHDLRRTSASHMAAIGVPPHIIKHILNHVDGKDVTQVYNRYAYDSEKREALQKWADYLFKVLDAKSDNVILLHRRYDFDSFAASGSKPL